MNYSFKVTEPQSFNMNGAKIKVYASPISSYFFHFPYRLEEVV